MSSSTVFVGIDIGKRRHVVAAVDQRKRVVLAPTSVKNTVHSYHALERRLFQLQQDEAVETILVGMETTGNYWQNLSYFLARRFPVVLINPQLTFAHARSELRRAKTDPLDAIGIATYLAEKHPSPTALAPVEREVLKDLDSMLEFLVRHRTSLVNRLRAELAKVAPELEEAFPRKISDRLLAVLEHFPTAEAIQQAPDEALAAVRYGRARRHLPASFVQNLKTLTARSVAYKTTAGSGLPVQTLARLIRLIDREIARLDQALIALFLDFNGGPSVLTTIKGVAERTAIAIEAHVGDVHRFPRAKHLVAYLGLNPTVKQSGSWRAAFNAIDKRGNARMRQRLYMAALSAVRAGANPMARKYHQLIKRGKPRRVAIVAAARSLAVLCYALLKHKRPYDPNYS